MYQIKNQIFLEFSKTQKSAVCNYLRALVKKSPDFSADDLLEKFIEDEKYYLELNSSRFPYLNDYIDNEQFIKDTVLYIKECIKYYEYKKRQEPIIQANKEFEKKKRKFLQEVKMSKDKPTKKQLYYYERLCKKYSIAKKETDSLSKLDLRNMIEEIINEHKTDCTSID